MAPASRTRMLKKTATSTTLPTVLQISGRWRRRRMARLLSLLPAFSIGWGETPDPNLRQPCCWILAGG